MAAKEIQAEILMEAVRHRLQGIRAADGSWFTPSRVVRASRLKDHWFRDSGFSLVYLVLPFPARETERPAKHVTFEHEFSILGARKFTGNDDPFLPGEQVVAPAAWSNGALAIAAQPSEPGQLVVDLRDDDASITAGVLQVDGLDSLGAAVSASIDLAQVPRSTSTGWQHTLLGSFASVSSAAITGAVGGGAADAVRILGGASRWQVANRMWKDIAERVGSSPQLKNEPGVSGVINVQVVDVDFDLEMEGWALVKVDLLITYDSRIGSL